MHSRADANLLVDVLGILTGSDVLTQLIQCLAPANLHGLLDAGYRLVGLSHSLVCCNFVEDLLGACWITTHRVGVKPLRQVCLVDALPLLAHALFNTLSQGLLDGVNLSICSDGVSWLRKRRPTPGPGIRIVLAHCKYASTNAVLEFKFNHLAG